MTIFIIITYKISFSNQIVDYFKSLNPMNGFQFNFLPIGLDESSEKDIIDNTNNRLENIKNLEKIIIFSDVGLPNKIAKRIKVKKNNIRIVKSKGSLIENGFLTYMVLNTKAPDKVVEEVIDKPIKK